LAEADVVQAFAASDRRPLRVAVLGSGRGSNFAALLAARQAGRLAIDLVGVFSDRPAALILRRAGEAGIPALAVPPRQYASRAVHEDALFAAVDDVQPDLIVCAGYMRIIGARALEGRSPRMINIHPSLLPRHRGLDTHQAALDAGDAEHGASVHFVTAELDGGPLIAQARVPVLPGDDAERLSARVLAREHPLLCACVDLFAQRRVVLSGAAVLIDGQRIERPWQLADDDRLIERAA